MAEGGVMNDIATPIDRPLWLRIADFPLVAMVVAIALYVMASVLAQYLGKFVEIGQPGTAAVHMVITIGLVATAYKLVIVRLGERPRDDLPIDGALPALGKGLAAGFLLFGAVVGVAAIL